MWFACIPSPEAKRPAFERLTAQVHDTPPPMFSLFEHTADMGIRAEAPDLATLFAEAARGLSSILVSDLQQIRPQVEVHVSLSADRHDDLLHDWLAELLFIFDTRHLLLSEFDVRLDGTNLDAVARGEPIDPQRHPLGMEIKAVTYHGLKLEPTHAGWMAEVIVDL